MAVEYIEVLASVCLLVKLLHDRWFKEDREALELPVCVGNLLDTGARQNIACPWIHCRQDSDKLFDIILKISTAGVLKVRDGLDQYSLVSVQSDGFGDCRILDLVGQAKSDGRWQIFERRAFSGLGWTKRVTQVV